MTLFSNQYKNRKVLVTGHTGFKGSWLTFWLSQLGAEVCGFSLAPSTSPNHWDLLKLDINSQYGDIRHAQSISKVCVDFEPEIVFHLAAQPLVRASYDDPLETWDTNVMGTANLLEACRQTPSVKAVIVVTSDKCYQNQEWSWGYRENDQLGGHDPYSASKAASELVVSSFRQSFFNKPNSPLIASVRAGNVIGGGDWAEDRLIPDLARAASENNTVEIRSPNATRPWQHVLESLSGYLLLGQKLLDNQKNFSGAWNFGPDLSGNRKVIKVLELMKTYWKELNWVIKEDKNNVHEANLLYLDSSKSRGILGWKPTWDIEESLRYTAEWYQSFQENESCLSQLQLDSYIEDAKKKGISWAV